MTPDGRIPLRTKILYGSGSLAQGVKDTSFNVFLLFFYTQVAGLSGSLAGTAILIALVLDAVSDPLVGYWSDRLKSGWGRRHPFMYFSAIPMGVSFFFLFNPPQGDQTTLFSWMLMWAVLTRFAMTFYMVPSSALTAEMTQDYDERTSLSGFRVLLGWLGGLSFATMGYLVFFAPTEQFEDGQLNPAAYQDFGLLGASIIIIGILLCALGTHHLIPHLKKVSEGSADSLGLKQDLVNMFANPPFRILVGFILIASSAIGFDQAISLYMLTYFWGLSTDQLALLSLASLVGTIAAFISAPILSKKYDKRPVAVVTVAILALGYPGWITLRLLGVLPDNDDPAILIIMLINSTVVVYAAVTMTIVFASMVADTIDYNELMTGRRQEAMFTSAYTFSLKATSGIGGFVAGITLDLVKFPTGVDASQVGAENLFSLGMTVAGTIVTFWLLAMLILRNYTLSREEHHRILDSITERRANPEYT